MGKYIGTISMENWTEQAVIAVYERLDGHEIYVGRESGRGGFRHYQFCMDCGGDLEEYNTNLCLGWHVERCVSWEDSKNYCRKTGNYLYIGNSREERYYNWIKSRGTLPLWTHIGATVASASDRQIDVWIDTRGSSAKSSFCYLLERRGKCLCVPRNCTAKGLIDYVAEYYNNEPMIIVDIPRADAIDTDLCHALEILKDGCISTSKYHGKKLFIKGVKILVFTNNPIAPAVMQKLTPDRWRRHSVAKWLHEHPSR